MLATAKSNSKSSKHEKDNEFYGVLNEPNIGKVVFGNYEFDTWYGNAAYFSSQGPHSILGYEFSNKIVNATGQKDKKKVIERISETESKSKNDSLWLDKLYICQYCFKYTDKEQFMGQHQAVCPLNSRFPSIGELLYRDDESPYFIIRVRGFMHQLFCQALSLFGKLFLEDKSVYYNVDAFDYYIIYGLNQNLDHTFPEEKFVPMGFFSKEVLSWDEDNNLACICVFPPFQRRHLGSLLIEFLYALARVTPGQYRSGPEFPLSPYGKMSYLRYWSRKLASILLQTFKINEEFNLAKLADITGFRKEDILLTLEYMQILQVTSDGGVTLSFGNLNQWCSENNVDPLQEKTMLNPNCLLI
ncbi:uncharacterized protein AC631_02657 [Debaryomyces fabryi]|uniref:histone acetyltransferase n=1 Tax=Debaryomyces fabryi TaxID=58627 RepID=A0A0V1PZ88_9ASCO|nr:uncharacterized protein AC631_02657 [Debaryomyces fabryi]KSA01582.1 hypothetical protein AC631_02657 [Debaryomyces fabryi]CUM49859.1 unnamed protein product [Debaryomyces fabryi]